MSWTDRHLRPYIAEKLYTIYISVDEMSYTTNTVNNIQNNDDVIN